MSAPTSVAWTDARARVALRAIFDAAVARAAPAAAVVRHLPKPPTGRCVVVGAGKASAAMAAAVDAAWPDVDLSGEVVTRYGHAVPAGRIEILQAAHPVPDLASVSAAETILKAVQDLQEDDLVLALISGGGSALMTLPAGEMTLSDKQAVNTALLKSGGTISEMNAVRKHLSAIKGGRLAFAAGPAKVVTLVMSDVPGDEPGIIASGPTIPDATSRAEILEIVSRLRLDLPDRPQAVLARDPAPVSRDASLDVRMIATPSLSLAAAADAARGLGLSPLILGDAIEGEARELGIAMAGIARSVRDHGLPIRAPTVLLSGGETTVSIGTEGCGKGGRNTELLLSFAIASQGRPGTWALAGDSDGIDGTEDAAGAIVTPSTLDRGRALALDARAHLSGHDSYSYFDALGDLVRTGPTLTNVNDIRAILIA